MNVWLTILAAGLLTYLTRLSFIFLTGRVTMPDWFMRGLRFVPAAVLTAIIVPETITWQGAPYPSWRNPQIWAALVAVLVALRVKNVLIIIGAGMLAFLVFQWLL
jgi:branched-subunit amino acid transport protein